MRDRTHNKQAIRRVLSRIRLIVEPYYFRLDEQKQRDDLLISPELSKTLKDYYRIDKKYLEDLINKKVPW